MTVVNVEKAELGLRDEGRSPQWRMPGCAVDAYIQTYRTAADRRDRDQ